MTPNNRNKYNYNKMKTTFTNFESPTPQIKCHSVFCI